MFGVRSIDTDIEINILPIDGNFSEMLENPDSSLPEILKSMYEGKSILAKTEEYGSLLVTPTSTPTHVSWVTEVYNQPVAFLAEFPNTLNSKNKIRFNELESKIVLPRDSQIKFDYVHDIYRPDEALTADLEEKMAARRDQMYGYNYRQLLASDSSVNSDVFKLYTYDDGENTGSWTCRNYIAPEYYSDLRERTGKCELELLVGGEESKISNASLADLQGEPIEWIGSNTILTQRAYGEYCTAQPTEYFMFDVTESQATFLIRNTFGDGGTCYGPKVRLLEFFDNRLLMVQSGTSTRLYKQIGSRSHLDFVKRLPDSTDGVSQYEINEVLLAQEAEFIQEFPEILQRISLSVKDVDQNGAPDLFFELDDNNYYIDLYSDIINLQPTP